MLAVERMLYAHMEMAPSLPIPTLRVPHNNSSAILTIRWQVLIVQLHRQPILPPLQPTPLIIAHKILPILIARVIAHKILTTLLVRAIIRPGIMEAIIVETTEEGDGAIVI